jgi:signal transduction histidine kinase
MQKIQVDNIKRYERGKQTIALMVNLFVFIGFIIEIITFYKKYLPLQLTLQIFSACVILFCLTLTLINRERFYVLSYLILSYFLISNIIIYDVFFPQFIETLNLPRVEFFMRNLFIILPFLAIIGFITSKRHIVIQGSILLLYGIYEVSINNDPFIRASALNYLITLVGFTWVIFFVVHSTQRFINDLNETNIKLKETQEHLVHSEKMAALGVLASGVAHEINNPLNFIQGGVHGLKDYIKANCTDHIEPTEPMIEAINVGVSRAAEIVTSLNRYGRRDDLPASECEVNSIIDNCLIMLNSEISGKIRINKEYSKPCVLFCNEGRLHQVFLNILLNAIQAILGNGTITISTSIKNTACYISISDTGCGISEEVLPRITDPFFTTKDPGKGTGLGLSIAYNIVQEYKGTLKFESKVGRGTNVLITLPVNIR